ncbi:MAG: flagellar biosynthesis protein FliQ [Angelakisella sp.]
MTEGQVLQIMQDALTVAFKLAGPMLIVSVLIGLVVAIFQAATQIHEQTLTFVPKVVVLSLMLLFMGSWMIKIFSEFVDRLFRLMMTL